MTIRPISLRDANAFVTDKHRHHGAVVGNKFSLALYDGDRLCGVAICGRPVARRYDDGYTLEVNRLCTDGTTNACSMLYGSCVKVARAMGYDRVITYILESENGASLREANFVCEGIAGGKHWTGVRDRGQDIPHEMKQRYVYYIRRAN